MLLLTMVCAAGMGFYVSRYRREQQAIQWLEANHGNYSIELCGPPWLHRLIGARFFERVSAARIDGSFARGNVIRLTDGDLHRLRALPGLRELSLQQALVTESQFRRFRYFPALRKLFVFQQDFPLKGIEELVDARPELDLNLAPAENLYHVSTFIYTMGEIPARQLIFANRVAADWKLECARYKGVGARTAALKQLVASLDRMPPPAAPLPPTENMLLRCAAARAKLDEARAGEDRAAEATALEETRQSAESMLASLRQAMSSNTLDVYDFDFAWQLANEPLLAHRRSGKNFARVAALHEQKVDDYRKMLKYLDRNPLGFDRGDLCQRTLVKFGLTKAKRELLEFRGERAATDKTLEDARGLAADLRAALRSAVEEAELDSLTAVAVYERSYDAGKTSVLPVKDQNAALASPAELKAWLTELYAASHQHCYDNFSPPLLATLLATIRLREQGRNAYEGTLTDLLRCEQEASSVSKASESPDTAPPAPGSL